MDENKTIYCGCVKYFKKKRLKNLIRYRDQRSINYKNNNNKNILIKNFVTMNMGLKKNIIKNYDKFFNLNFNYYGFEDFELAYRLKKNGINFKLINSKIYHKDFRDFKIFLEKYYYLGKFGVKELARINIKAAEKSIFYKISKNKLVYLLIKFPYIHLILNKIQKMIIFIEKRVNFYLPILYKSGIFISFIRGLKNQNNNKKEISSYKSSLKNWYE